MLARNNHRTGGGGGVRRSPPDPPPPRYHDAHGRHPPPMMPRPAHPAFFDDLRADPPFGHGGGGPRPPLHPAIIEEHLAAQHHEIQGLLVDNQRLAATHVALKQELAAAQYELQRLAHAADAMHSEKDIQLREAYEKSTKLEMELNAADAQRIELIRVRGDIQKLNVSRQELTNQVQALNQDISRSRAELQQMPAIKSEIEAMKHELQRARTAIEYEKKTYAENFEQGQLMEKNLILMTHEVDKLRSEISNAETRSRAMTAAENAGGGPAGYCGNYGNPDSGYGGNLYAASLGMNHVQGVVDGGGQYGSERGSSGGYDVQRAPRGR